MSVESDFFSLLSSDSGVTALVAQRIYPDGMPETTAYPAVVFSRELTEPDGLLDGSKATERVELSVQVWGETRASVTAVADAIEAAIDGLTFAVIGRSDTADYEVGLLGCVLSVDIFIL